MRRLICLFLSVFFLATLFPTSLSTFAADGSGADGIALDISQGNIIINTTNSTYNGGGTAGGSYTSGQAITITGSSTTSAVTVNGIGSANITIDNVNIDASSGSSAFSITDKASVNLTLQGTNTLKSGRSFAGFQVPLGTTLTITDVSTGSLTAIGSDSCAGIGGDGNKFENCGTVTIRGGTVAATGGSCGAGIGGGYNGNGGTVSISGGTVTATSNFGGGAGIGSGCYGNGGTVSISGGTVTAASDGGAGIGSGENGNGGTVTISGGTVTATCSDFGGAGIGSGENSNGSTVTISGGTVRAIGSDFGGAGIGGSQSGNNGIVTISGGTVSAVGGDHGGGEYGDSGTVIVSSGTVTAIGGDYGAGIGGGQCGSGGKVSIIYGTVTATGGQYGAGIGGGIDGDGGTVSISSGTVKATGGQYGAGIGGGGGSINYGTVSISGGTVTSTGGQNGAGIGGGGGGNGGTVSISGGVVTTTGGENGAGIGGGRIGSPGNIHISSLAAVMAISPNKPSIHADNSSNGSVINAKLNSAISTSETTYLKCGSSALPLPANYTYFAFSAASSSAIQVYSDSNCTKKMYDIATSSDGSLNIPVSSNIYDSPTDVTLSVPTPTNSVTPTVATYDVRRLPEFSVAVSTTSAITSVINGTSALKAGTDYTVTGNILSIAPGYLNYYFNKFQQDLKLVIKFSTGDPITLTVKPLRVVEAVLAPSEAKIDQANTVDVPVAMRLNGSVFLSVYNGTSALNPGTDYTVSNNIVTIKKGYIKYYVTKFPTQNLNLIFKFSNGYDQILSLYIGDSPNTTITPASLTYKVGSKADINLTANMNGNFFSSINNGTAALVPRVDYTYAVTTNTLLIKSSYMSYYFNKFHQNLVLQVNFTGGTPATLTIMPDWGTGTTTK